jgi:hypothetical protein
VTVVGAVGGVGASTLAVLLARRWAADGESVTLVDLDPVGGGIEVLLGIEAVEGIRWADLGGVRGTLESTDLDGLLPTWCGVDVLSGDRRTGPVEGEALRAVWGALSGAGRVVVADLPGHAAIAPDGGPGPLSGGRDVLLVTGQDVLGVAGGVRVRGSLGSRVQLVLRRRARARVAPLEAAQLLDADLVGLLPGDRRLPEGADRGFGPVVAAWSPLGRSVRRIARGLARG